MSRGRIVILSGVQLVVAWDKHKLGFYYSGAGPVVLDMIKHNEAVELRRTLDEFIKESEVK